MSAVLQPSTSIEPMSEGDIAAVAQIERRIYAFPWTFGNFLDSLRAGYSCWICRDRERIVGYAVLMIAANEAHLLNLSIDVCFQRQGHGSRFLQYLVTAAREHGACVLFLEVRPSNEAGLGLYAKHGFRRVGVRRDYYPAPEGRENAVVLSLDL